MNQQEKDVFYMRRCIQLAACGMQKARPNPMVGAVIVAEDRIIGEGYHVRCGEGHAEVNAFASVTVADERLLPESTIYVSLEPCAHYGKTPPCADLIVSRGVRRCVVGCQDPFAKVQGRGIKKMRDAGIEVEVGVLEKECKELNRRFFTFHQNKRPYVILKWAQTTNGYIDDNYRPLAISTDYTRMLVHKLRAEVDAILVGHTTDEREHPQLNVRYWTGQQPRRLVLTHERTLEELMNELYAAQMESLMVEGGAQTLQSFIDAGLWDEIRVETSPQMVAGGTAAPTLPTTVRLVSRDMIDGNVISSYRRCADDILL